MEANRFLLITRRDRDFDLGLVAVEQDDGGPRPGRRLVALPLPAEGALDRTGPDHFLSEDDLVRSLGDGGIVHGGRKAALFLFRGREDEIELFAGAAPRHREAVDDEVEPEDAVFIENVVHPERGSVVEVLFGQDLLPPPGRDLFPGLPTQGLGPGMIEEEVGVILFHAPRPGRLVEKFSRAGGVRLPDGVLALHGQAEFDVPPPGGAEGKLAGGMKNREHEKDSRDHPEQDHDRAVHDLTNLPHFILHERDLTSRGPFAILSKLKGS